MKRSARGLAAMRARGAGSSCGCAQIRLDRWRQFSCICLRTDQRRVLERRVLQRRVLRAAFLADE